MKPALDTKLTKLNAAYRAATPAQRRVMIAQDALAQLKAKRFRSQRGCWTEVELRGGESPDPCEPLQPLLHKATTRCHCCGAGAIFLSYVRLNNQASDTSGHSFYDIQWATKWPDDNLRLIEMAFEFGRGGIRDTGCFRLEKAAAAINFTASHEDDDQRLMSILTNIIANKGTFNPMKKTK